MNIDERLRLSIHTKLTDLIGHDEADALIAHIMPVPWHDVATTTALENQGILLRAEMTELRTELRAEMAELRTELRAEMTELRTELRAEMTELRTELHAEMAVLRADMGREMADLRTELHQAIISQTRWLMGYVTALSAIMLTVARLLF